MQKNPRLLFTWVIGATVTCFVLGYAYLATKDFIAGPQITVISPTDGETATSSPIDIVGIAKNISSITLDDRKIFIDDEGNFKEKLLLYPGYNIISVKAEDRYKRTTEKTIRLVFIKQQSEGTSSPQMP
jgi:hypothetical protein